MQYSQLLIYQSVSAGHLLTCPFWELAMGTVLTNLGLGDNNCILFLLEKCGVVISVESRTEKCLQ